MTFARLLFAALPPAARYVLAIAAVVLAAHALHRWAVRGAIEDDRARAAAQAQTSARAADDAAWGQIEDTRNNVETENRAAREAAAAGADSLGDGLRSLRAGQAGAGAATR